MTVEGGGHLSRGSLEGSGWWWLLTDPSISDPHKKHVIRREGLGAPLALTRLVISKTSSKGFGRYPQCG
jgi:hypothetical protein